MPLVSHFWTSIPGQLAPLLSFANVVAVVGVCDTILYRSVLKVLLPRETGWGGWVARGQTPSSWVVL